MKKILIPLCISSLLLISGCNYSSISSVQSVSAETLQSQSKPQIEYYFTKENEHPEVALESLLNSAQSNIDIAIYSLTQHDIVDDIIKAEQRGITVRIITDKIESKSKYEKEELTLLHNAGIPLKINSHSGLMHLKMTVVDHDVVTTGSFNYTKSASTINDEVLVVIKDLVIASEWDSEFNTMWNDSKDYSDIKY